MRCICCNKILSEFESTRKSIKTGEYLDMCNRCYGTISNDVLSYERYDLYDDEDEADPRQAYDLDGFDDYHSHKSIDNNS